jgi:hypothetical protein
MNELNKVKIAENMSFDNYDEQPIEDFGKTLLKKMGWSENTAINGKAPVKVVEFKPRPSGLGLGAVMLDDRAPKYSDEKKINYYGTKVRITKGKHKGLKGVIVDEIIGDIEKYFKQHEFVSIELKINKQVVKINTEYVKIRNKKDKEEREEKREVVSNKASRLTWVVPNIIVKVVNKDSKYYNTKAYIEDVIDNYSFSLITNDKVVHTKFTEDDIQTVMPGINENVIILTGSKKGEIAKLLERDKKKNKVSVQLITDFEIRNYTQDEVCSIK